MNSSNNSSKAPTHVVYHVRDGGNNKKGFWTRIGAAWAHADGKGFNVHIAEAVAERRSPA